MRLLLVVSLLVLCVPSHATLLTGWVTNPTNGHEYALWGEGNWQDAYAATPGGAHIVTFQNAAEETWVRDTFEPSMDADWGTWNGVYGPNYR
ncbi:MAG TPA: hypothetical protein QGH10_02045, partial [Armatimonadota bacterium]|nr:hypothetical protein [Armatimonadota bacterium]